jgi:hypothetical protein
LDWLKTLLPVILILISFPLFSAGPQSTTDITLAAGYKSIQLGSSMTEVQDEIRKSGDFKEKREEILTIRLEPDTEIISTDGRGFIQKGYFHFHQDQLFQILLKIDENRIGYFVILSQLTEKYGTPTRFNPQTAEWSDGKTTITLEKTMHTQVQAERDMGQVDNRRHDNRHHA